MDAFVGVTFGEPLQLENHSVIDAISLTSGQSIMFPLHLSEPAFNAHFELFGDNNGDADLYVRPAVSAGEVEGCYSSGGESNELCTFEQLPAGDYWVEIIAFESFDYVTLTVDWQTQTVEPFFPQAICQHSVISQMGK